MTWNGQLSNWMPPANTVTVPDLRTSTLSSETSVALAGAGASMRSAAPLLPGTSSVSPPTLAPVPRTTSTLRSGIS